MNKTKQKEALDLIRALINLLPNSIHLSEEDSGEVNPSWKWCWDELDSEAQDQVEKINIEAAQFLKVNFAEVSADELRCCNNKEVRNKEVREKQ